MPVGPQAHQSHQKNGSKRMEVLHCLMAAGFYLIFVFFCFACKAFSVFMFVALSPRGVCEGADDRRTHAATCGPAVLRPGRRDLTVTAGFTWENFSPRIDQL